MEKAQQRALSIMRPLSRLWLTLEGAVACQENQQEIEEMVQCLEKTIMQTAIFTKRYDVNFKKDRGNFQALLVQNPSMKAAFFNRTSKKTIQEDFPDINPDIQLDKVDKKVVQKFQH